MTKAGITIRGVVIDNYIHHACFQNALELLDIMLKL